MVVQTNPPIGGNEMLSKTRTTIITLIAAASFAVAALVPAVSQAKEAGGQPEKKGCTLTTPVGTKLQYNDGDKVKVKTDDLPTQTYECQDGKWKCVTRQAQAVSGVPTVVGATMGPPEGNPAPPVRSLAVTSSPSAAH
jgi:hypothetical protein